MLTLVMARDDVRKQDQNTTDINQQNQNTTTATSTSTSTAATAAGLTQGTEQDWLR